MTMMSDMKEHIGLLGKRCDETLVLVQNVQSDLKIVKESSAQEFRRFINVSCSIVMQCDLHLIVLLCWLFVFFSVISLHLVPLKEDVHLLMHLIL
jgi:hypothetical protein